MSSGVPNADGQTPEDKSLHRQSDIGSQPSPGPWLWTDRQRVALCALVAAFGMVLAVRCWVNPACIPDPPSDPSARSGELPDRIDPNTADWPTLAALPVLGKAGAQRIVADRDAFRAEHPDQVPFARLDDLLRIKGIGPATIRALEPYLLFPEQRDRPTTRP